MFVVEHLVKRYGSVVAVDDVSFACRPGRVTGFLGPNGAGKSTTLRMLTALTPPTSGTSSVAGRPYGDLVNPGRTVGVMLDAAAQHPGRSGRETLRLAAMLQRVPLARADAMLELVGLADAAKRSVRAYSLGMRQRLGLATALLGEPQGLVLDEPANGLDPEGIRWMRLLLRGFAARGGTVLLSSHLLREMEATVDDVVVIGSGRVVAQGAIEELLGSGGGARVRSLDDARLADVLRRAGVVVTAPAAGGLLVDAAPEAVGRAALAEGVVLTELTGTGSTLEDLFFRLTEQAAGPPADLPGAGPPAPVTGPAAAPGVAR